MFPYFPRQKNISKKTLPHQKSYKNQLQANEKNQAHIQTKEFGKGFAYGNKKKITHIFIYTGNL
jgi:hypothetical protein